MTHISKEEEEEEKKSVKKIDKTNCFTLRQDFMIQWSYA